MHPVTFGKIYPTRYLFWILLLMIVVFRYWSALPTYQDGDRLRLTGKVLTEPTRYDFSQRVNLLGLRFYLDPLPQVNYGDNIVVEGVVEDKELKDAKLIEIISSDSPLYAFRNKLIAFYSRSLPSPHSELIAGVTLGSKQNISKEFYKDLKKSGTLHVVVASGMNVTLVAGFLTALLVLIFPRKKAVWFAIVGVWVYALMSGFNAPIIRAAIMGTLAFSAVAMGRLNVAWRALILSALIMLIIWPAWLTDLGFILSFTATASLILFGTRINNKLQFVPSIFREGLATSLAAMIGVIGILFLAFGQFNPLSPLVNALVLWSIGPMTIIGMAAGLVGLIFEPLGRLLLYLAYPLTSWFVGIIAFFS